MGAPAELWRKLKVFFRRGQFDRDLEEEMQHHLAMKAEAYLGRQEGMSSKEAGNAARREFGNTLLLREKSRDTWGFAGLEILLQDLRYGLRMLRKSPGFTLVAVLTLALGIGANTAIFSLIDAVMLRSLPVSSPSQLVLLRWSAHHFPRIHGYMFSNDCLETDLELEGGSNANPSGCSFSEPMLREIEGTHVLSAAAAFANLGSESLDLSGNGTATGIQGELVSGSFFSAMGIQPALGRLLQSADDTSSAPAVAVLSSNYWKSGFGGSRDILGRVIRLNKIPVTIVGVAERRFTGMIPGTENDIWLPLSDAQRITGGRGDPADDSRFWWLTIVGRLKPGVQRPQAQAAVNLLFRNEILHGSRPLSTAAENPQVVLVPAQTGLTGDRGLYANPLYVLMFGVGIILLIACANVAGLMLARASTRKKEMAIRLTLGAGRSRLLRQLLTESLMLSACGGMLGILLADWAAHAIIQFVSHNQPQPAAFATSIDARVLGFTIAVTVLSGLLFGIAPSLRNAGVDLNPALKEGEGSSTRSAGLSGIWSSFGNSLVVAQVALSIVVLAGSGLLVRTLANLRSVNVGFDRKNVLTFSVNLRRLGYQTDQSDAVYRDLQGRLAGIPGVQSVSYSSDPLLENYLDSVSFHPPGTRQDEEAEADMLLVGPHFFSTMRVPFVAGRSFNSSDFALAAENGSAKPSGAPTPVIVDQTFVKKFLGKENVLGNQFGASSATGDTPANPGYEIIGVVGEARFCNLREIRPTVYEPRSAGWAWFQLRTAIAPHSVLPSVRKLVTQVDSNLPLFDVTTEAGNINRLLFRERLLAWLSSFFGLVALLLACIGLYGLLSYDVSRRTREIGIRLALGAQPGSVLKLVVRQGVLLAVAGAAVGIGAALAVTRFISSMLYGIHADDPVTFAALSLLLLAVALLACYIPARRAMRVDPMVALRYE